jgi:hypothetical protein
LYCTYGAVGTVLSALYSTCHLRIKAQQQHLPKIALYAATPEILSIVNREKKKKRILPPEKVNMISNKLFSRT